MTSDQPDIYQTLPWLWCHLNPFYNTRTGLRRASDQMYNRCCQLGKVTTTMHNTYKIHFTNQMKYSVMCINFVIVSDCSVNTEWNEKQSRDRQRSVRLRDFTVTLQTSRKSFCTLSHTQSCSGRTLKSNTEASVATQHHCLFTPEANSKSWAGIQF